MAVMTAAFLLCSVLVALTTASSSQYYSKHSYSSDSGYDSKPEGVYYGGKYAGSCGQDGIYYNDEYSFVQCAHNIAYMQPCAPGSRNSDSSNMQVGKFYDQAPMCDVNLVDYGYSVFNSRRPSGYGGHGSSGQGSSGYGSSGHGSSGYGSSSYHSGYPSSSSHSGYSAPSSSYGSHKSYSSYSAPRYPTYSSGSSYSSHRPSSYSKPASTKYDYGASSSHSSSYSAPQQSHYSSGGSSYKPAVSNKHSSYGSYHKGSYHKDSYHKDSYNKGSVSHNVHY